MTDLPYRWSCRLLTTFARRHAASELMQAFVSTHHSNVNFVVCALIQIDGFTAGVLQQQKALLAIAVHGAACLPAYNCLLTNAAGYCARHSSAAVIQDCQLDCPFCGQRVAYEAPLLCSHAADGILLDMS